MALAGCEGRQGDDGLQMSSDGQNDRQVVLGYERLLTEMELIDLLSLHDRPNPAGTVRWLIRTKRLKVVRIARGILRFRPTDVQAFIQENHRT